MLLPPKKTLYSSLALAWLGLLITAIPAFAVKVVEGPVVLHANLCNHWGGHTFSYAVRGERYLFWTATLYQAQKREDGKEMFPATVIGQYPLPGTDGTPAVFPLKLDEPRLFMVDEPLIFRSPDGYLHLLVGRYHSTDNPLFSPGTVKYYRSIRPEDVTEWVDRTELLPTTELYHAFHLRMNVAISPDGERVAFTILAISEGGDPVPWNTPLIYYGKREGLDFRFSEPIKYHEPMPFFYPLVAPLPEGVVLVGEIWENTERVTARLCHLDWEGHLLHEELLPAAEQKGTYLAYDLRPAQPGEQDRLVIYQRYAPEKGQIYHQFLTYDLPQRRLEVVRKVPVEIGYSNYGKWWYLGPERSIFFNNPCQGQYWTWEGNLLGEGEVKSQPLPFTNPLELGYVNSGDSLMPHPFNGSLTPPGEFYLFTDTSNPGRNLTERGPCSFLFWRIVE